MDKDHESLLGESFKSILLVNHGTIAGMHVQFAESILFHPFIIYIDILFFVLTETEVPSPNRVSSAPSRKDRISFRDNPVRQSGGWGGGKKRTQLNK